MDIRKMTKLSDLNLYKLFAVKGSKEGGGGVHELKSTTTKKIRSFEVSSSMFFQNGIRDGIEHVCNWKGKDIFV